MSNKHQITTQGNSFDAFAVNRILQRKCECGNHTLAGGECSSCSKERETSLRRSAINRKPAAGRNSVPPIVHEVLRSPGQPLDAATRAFMEPRFGRDFSRVRVHADTRAAESARAVNAYAYTVGNDVVFSAGRYEPGTETGHRLIAHELTHTIQQRAVGGQSSSADAGTNVSDGSDVEMMQASTRIPNTLRLGPHHDALEAEADQAAQSILLDRGLRLGLEASEPRLQGAWVSCGEPSECPRRATGEIERARSARLRAGALDAPEAGFIVYGFPVGGHDASSLAANSLFQTFDRQVAAGSDRWQVLGFSDCEGTESRNHALRSARSSGVVAALSAGARAKISRTASANSNDCVADNDTEMNREFNRSVVFQRTETQYTFPDEQIRPNPISPNVEDCEPGDARAISNALRVAPLAIRIAANAILGSPRRPDVTAALIQYFGPNAPSQAVGIALRLHRIAASLPSVAVECEYPGSFGYDTFCSPGNIAYTRPIPALIGIGNIHVCQPQYRNQGRPLFQVTTLIHEAAHRFLDVSDEGYYTLECTETPETIGLSEGQRRNNADCWACLVQAILERVL